MDKEDKIENLEEENSLKEEKVEKVEKKEKAKKKDKDNKLLEENKALQEKVLRMNADMQNMKRRFEDEIAKIYKYDGEELIIKLLPIVDNFERAIKLDDNDLSDELSKFLSGFKMIYGNLVDILNTMEVKEIEAQDKDFDPNLMQAVLTDKDELYPPNQVLDVMQKGYMYKDKVIRPAMVKVNE